VMLFGGDVHSAFIYVGFGLAGFTLVAGIILESATSLLNTPLMKEAGLSLLSRVSHVVLYELFIYGFRLIPVVLLWLVLEPSLSLDVLQILYSYPVFLLFICGSAFLIAPIALRYRDVGPILGVMMRWAMFLSPVVWDEKKVVNEDIFRKINDINPVGISVEILRDPFLGTSPSSIRLLSIAIVGALVMFGGLLTVALTRNKVNYWS
jgi:ABC-type polysaccharide/polyol phosphate export permease